VETEGPQITSQYGAYALRAGLARLYARMRMHTPTRSGTHKHPRTRKHAHTDQYVILIAFTQQQRFREHASTLCYTYIACLVINYVHAKNVSSNTQLVRSLGQSLQANTRIAALLPYITPNPLPPTSCTIRHSQISVIQRYINCAYWNNSVKEAIPFRNPDTKVHLMQTNMKVETRVTFCSWVAYLDRRTVCGP
jgi:hypothetical protein